MEVLRRPRARTHSRGSTVEPLVRAVPGSILLRETYEYEQLVSRNPAGPNERSRSAVIEVITPFDGHRHFGPAAVADTEHALQDVSNGTFVETSIGHLLLDNHRNATFPVEAGLDNQYGSIPLRIGLRAPAMAMPLDDDSWQHHSCIQYQPPPDIPRIPPLHVDVTISDPDNTNLSGHLREIDLSDGIAAEISKYIAFEANLVLTIEAKLALPAASRKRASFTAKIEKVELDWPSITSLEPSVLQLRIGDERREVQHNPGTRTLEWSDVELDPSSEVLAGLEQFTSPPMQLSIGNPGELYEERRLACRLTVVVTNRLVSGIDAYAFDARGRRLPRNPTLHTRLVTVVTTELGEAFADRLLTTFQHVHFDEIVPREMRIGDIKTALHDLGFSVDSERRLASTDEHIEHAILTSRQEGPDRLHLLIVVRGLKHKTERQSERDGTRYTTELDSGELQLSVRGALPGNSREVVGEVNRLHVALRAQFERVRDQR